MDQNLPSRMRMASEVMVLATPAHHRRQQGEQGLPEERNSRCCEFFCQGNTMSTEGIEGDGTALGGHLVTVTSSDSFTRFPPPEYPHVPVTGTFEYTYIFSKCIYVFQNSGTHNYSGN